MPSIGMSIAFLRVTHSPVGGFYTPSDSQLLINKVNNDSSNLAVIANTPVEFDANETFAEISARIDVILSSPVQNKLVTVGFTDTNIPDIFAILTPTDATFVEAKEVGQDKFFIRSIVDTDVDVTETFSEFGTRIDILSFPVEEQNKLFTLTFSDGGQIIYVLIETDFVAFLLAEEFPTVILTAVSNTTNPAQSLAQLRDLIITKLDEIGVIEDEVNDTMVSQSIGAFEIIDGRLIGEILYIAQSSFNPFWYGKEISSLVQIKRNPTDVIGLKENRITFTETSREQRVLIDEPVGDLPAVIVEFFVQVADDINDFRDFSAPKQIVVEIGIPSPPDTDTQKRDSLFDKAKGVLIGSFVLSLLASRK